MIHSVVMSGNLPFSRFVMIPMMLIWILTLTIPTIVFHGVAGASARGSNSPAAVSARCRQGGAYSPSYSSSDRVEAWAVFETGTTSSEALDFTYGSFSDAMERCIVGIDNFSVHDKQIFVVEGTPSQVRADATYAYSLLRQSKKFGSVTRGSVSETFKDVVDATRK